MRHRAAETAVVRQHRTDLLVARHQPGAPAVPERHCAERACRARAGVEGRRVERAFAPERKARRIGRGHFHGGYGRLERTNPAEDSANRSAGHANRRAPAPGRAAACARTPPGTRPRRRSPRRLRGAFHEQQPLRPGRAQIELHAHRRRNDRVALAVDDEQRRADPPDLRRRIEPSCEHRVDRVDAGDPRLAQQGRDRRRGGLDDDAAHVGITRREFERGHGAERVAVDEAQCRIGLVPAELVPRGFRVLVHRHLGQRPAAALAEAAIVDHQDRGAGPVDGRGDVHHAGDGASRPMQEQHDRRVTVVRQEPAVHPLAAGADAQPDIEVAEADHARGLPQLGLGEVDEPVGEVP